MKKDNDQSGEKEVCGMRSGGFLVGGGRGVFGMGGSQWISGRRGGQGLG